MAERVNSNETCISYKIKIQTKQNITGNTYMIQIGHQNMK